MTDHRIKLEKKSKRGIDLARELKNKQTMEYEGDDYTNRDLCIRYSNWKTIKGNGGLVNWKKYGDHPNDNVVENGQNTEKTPGDVRRLAVTETPKKDHQLNWYEKL